MEWLLALFVGLSSGHLCYPPERVVPKEPVRNGLIVFSGTRNLGTVRPDGSEFTKFERGGRWRRNSPAWSPDGSRVAFMCRGDGYAGKPTQEICTADPDGSDIRRLTYDHRADDEPSWSPDGRYLVFTRILGERFDYESSELFLIPSEGGEMRRITYRAGSEGWPSFSPDGCRIMFDAESKEGPYPGAAPDRGLYSVNVHGGDFRTEVDVSGRDEEGGRWSPDGKIISFEVGWRIWVHNTDTDEDKNLVFGITPSWSPDGRSLLYQHFSNAEQRSSLRRVNVRTGEVATVVQGRAYVASWRARR